MKVSNRDEAVELLYENIHALRDEDSAVLNLMPFTHESAAANALKRQFSQAIITLLRNAGHLVDRQEVAPPITRDVSVHCRSCGELLLKTHLNAEGKANVAAASVISALAQREPTCPHAVVTPEMQRQRIQDAVLAAKAEQGEQDGS